jgi:rhodanese-related sulfurtransferase
MAEQSRTNRWLAAVAGALAAVALAAGEPYPAERAPAIARDVSFVTAVDVARWIRNGQPGVRIVDVRDDSLFAAYHIPGAERFALDELPGRAWGRDENVVVYAEDDRKATRAAMELRSRGVTHAHVLRGGLLSWVDEIVEPRLAPLPVSATPDDQAARREQLELSRYFGGTPVVSPSGGKGTAGSGERVRTGAASEAAAVARTIRRGC